jgi:hypothetical protein
LLKVVMLEEVVEVEEVGEREWRRSSKSVIPD